MDAEQIINFTFSKFCHPIAEIYCSFEQPFICIFICRQIAVYLILMSMLHIWIIYISFGYEHNYNIYDIDKEYQVN